jgi:hypothetical protein
VARLDDVEREAVEESVGRWSRDVDRLKRSVLALWSARGEVLTGAELRALVAKLDTPPPADLSRWVREAARIGDKAVPGNTAVHESTVAAAVAAGIAPRAVKAREEAARRSAVARVESLSEVLTVMAPLTGSVSTMRGDAEFAVHRARNEAVASAARQTGAKLVFVPERDACLRCIGLSGATGGDIDLPPIHPHCRCEVEPYDDEAVPLALKREAVRSVLRGFSLPSESEAARLRAARDMLGRRPAAPESVKAYARAAIRRGKFPRGRRLP